MTVKPRPGRAIVIASDIHLAPDMPRTAAAFGRFIDSLDGTVVGDVYLLGDLFEFWVGDDMMSAPPLRAFLTTVTARLASLSRRGIRLWIMRGNRDFLLGRRFARAAGARLLRDPFVFNAFGQRWALTHGDALCTDDVAYQRFRTVSRIHWLQYLFLKLPLSQRMRFATGLRSRSAGVGQARDQDDRLRYLSDVSEAAVLTLFDASDAQTLIHGHTHRPAVHDHTAALNAGLPRDAVTGTLPRQRWVLPDWDVDSAPARAGYLRIDAGGIQLIGVADDGNGDGESGALLP